MSTSHDPKAPPESGELKLILPISPISSQAKRLQREAAVEAVREVLRPLEYILTGDVRFDLAWLVPGRLRYESDISPDLENITKPLIDAFCGPEGILIDDCQIKSFSSAWMDWMGHDQQVWVTIEFIDNQFVLKQNLTFIQIEGALCLPIEGHLEPRALKVWLEAYRSRIDAWSKMQDLGVHDVHIRPLLPVHRVFHRTRIHGFRVVDLDTLERETAALPPAI